MPTRRLVISTVEEDVKRAVLDGDSHEGQTATFPAMSYIIATGDLVPPWWSRTRDIELHRLVKQNNHLSGIAYAATTKLKNIPISFVPVNPSISAHVTYAERFTEMVRLSSEFGAGLRKALEKFLYDYFIFDNGAFFEVLGDGPSDGPILGPAHGVRHLDSLRCTRTGDLIYPVIYETAKNHKRYKLHFTRVISMSQQTSGISTMNGIGFSAASRSFEIGQVLSDQLDYKLEKMGSRPASKIIVAKGIDTNEVIKSFMMAEELMDSLGLRRYAKTVVIGGDPDIDVSAVDLNNFEPFDEETGTLMAMFALAFIWGLDVRDVWPIQGAKSSDQVANMKARGRLPADFTADLKDQFDLKLCPSFLNTKFDFQDDEEDQLKAVNRDIRSRMVQRMSESGTLDQEAQRRMMLEAGDITRADFIRQQLDSGKLENGSPIAVLFFSDDKIIKPLLTLSGILDPLIYEDNDKEEVVKQIHIQKSAALKLLAETASRSQNQRALSAIAALDWLEQEYEDIPEEVPIALQQAEAEAEAEGMEGEIVEGEDEAPDEQEPDEEQEKPEEQELEQQER